MRMKPPQTLSVSLVRFKAAISQLKNCLSNEKIPHARESGLWNPGHFAFFCGNQNLEYGIQLKESRIH